MIKTEINADFGTIGLLDAEAGPPKSGDTGVADLAELIFEVARERLDVSPGDAFGLEDIERAGLLDSESTGPLREPQYAGREAFEASRMRESLQHFFSPGPW